MSGGIARPKVFISYSWSGADHEAFVLEFATSLRSTWAIDVVLDKWHLKPGQDVHAFMESMVVDPSIARVLVVCDRKYQEKADGRKGGVGTEGRIISQEVYAKVDQTKFIPIVRERDSNGDPYLPVMLKGLRYIDLSSDDAFGENLEELARWIWDRPLLPVPELGEPPEFLTSMSAGLPMAKDLSSALRAIRDGKPNREGLENLFVKSVLQEVDRLTVTPDATLSGYDEYIHQAILKTKGLRDQLAEYVDAVGSFGPDAPTLARPIRTLLDGFGERLYPRVERGPFHECWSDVPAFVGLETCLLVVAALLRYERWEMLHAVLEHRYLAYVDHGTTKALPISVFSRSFQSLDEHRNNRLKLNRASVTADMLKERCSTMHIAFSELAQADLFLSLHSVAHYVKNQNESDRASWCPQTAVYRELRNAPVFLKAGAPNIRRGILRALGVSDGPELLRCVNEAEPLLNGFKWLVPGPFNRLDLRTSVNLAALAIPD